MKKPLWILFTMTLVGVLPFACDFGTNSNYATSFTIERLSLISGELDEDYSHSAVGVDPINFEVESDTLSHSELAFAFFPDSATYHSGLFNIKLNGIFQSAYAEPVEPRSDAKIALISIYSDQSIITESSEFQAEENLTSIFEAKRSYKDWSGIYKMLENFDDWYIYEPILLRFSEMPTHVINQSFTIKVTMDNEKVFELKSGTIISK